MQYYISNKMRNMKPSAVREILKNSAAPGIIPMSAGSPAPETLPVDDIRRLMDEIMREDISAALVYSISEGYPALREELKRYVAAQSNIKEFDDLMVVSGAQQCMDLACKVFCDEGDTVLCEDPSFIGNLNCMRSYGINLVGVPVESDGIDVARLEHELKTQKNVRFLYLIPNYQNPTGITMSLQKRKACYELAKRYGVLILEDNPYGDLRFSGESLPSIKSMDRDGIVLYAGTFSKILSPGVRIGFLVAHQEPFAKLTVGKQCVDVHSSMLAQLLCLRFLQECDLDAHIKTLSKVYERKCGLMLRELDKIPAEKLSYTRPDGGLFVWATLHGVDDAADFCSQLIAKYKVAAVPGSAFRVEQNAPSPSFRMTYATPTDEQIVTGIGHIAQLLKTY